MPTTGRYVAARRRSGKVGPEGPLLPGAGTSSPRLAMSAMSRLWTLAVRISVHTRECVCLCELCVLGGGEVGGEGGWGGRACVRACVRVCVRACVCVCVCVC